ncbi:MAG: sensor histidine kinase [Bacteriovoracaceae bacterium]|nr:sensor histidine kinase [Bacteriovoracaceae bacterium]
MISIKYWFYRNAKLPLIQVGVGIVLIVACFFSYSLYRNNQVQRETAKNLFIIANHALEKNYRPILETAIAVAFEELDARKILLCKNEKTIFVYPHGAEGCERGKNSSIFVELLEIPVIGKRDLKFYFFMPRIKFSPSYIPLLGTVFVFFIVIYLLIFKIYRKISSDILRPLERNLLSDEQMNIIQFESLRKKIKEFSKTKEKDAVANAIIEHNINIRHNVKSALLTLDEFNNSLGGESISLGKKEMLNGAIESIGKLLLRLSENKKNEKKYGVTSRGSSFVDYVEDVNNQKAVVLINQLLDNCVEAKRVEYKNIINGLNVKVDLSDEVANSFLNIVDFEFRAVISNMINNSIQALGEDCKTVGVRTRKVNGQVVINIWDTGNGIPAEIVDKIFLRNFSHNKPEGTGYGLYHAKTFIESWEGEINLTKTSIEGSEFQITLPVWEPSEIRLKDQTTVVILDDDKRIHENWTQKINEFCSRCGIAINVKKFEEVQIFFNWFNNADIDFTNIIFLIDQYIEEGNTKGTDIIESLGIVDVSWLVTNSYDETALIDVCNELHIKILPKACIDYVKLLA